jgi:hypothetical protein
VFRLLKVVVETLEKAAHSLWEFTELSAFKHLNIPKWLQTVLHTSTFSRCKYPFFSCGIFRSIVHLNTQCLLACICRDVIDRFTDRLGLALSVTKFRMIVISTFNSTAASWAGVYKMSHLNHVIMSK